MESRHEYLKERRYGITQEDFNKRKRIKNFVPIYIRCCAMRANNEQCTRRKKGDFDYCGTHIKGQPYGVVHKETAEPNKILIKNVEIWNEEINGIHYYIDNNENVYKTEDILSNKTNPTVITQYVKIDGKYTIPSYFQNK